MIDKGTHLLILMWLHMDYTCCLAGSANPVLGALSLFGGVSGGLLHRDVRHRAVFSLGETPGRVLRSA